MISERWNFGAGILFAAKDGDGHHRILLGQRRKNKASEILQRIGFHLDGWSIPFGQLGEDDKGNYRACAVREAVEEIFAMREGVPYRECLTRLDAGMGIAGSHSISERLFPREGWNPLAWAPGINHRIFFVRLPCVPTIDLPGDWSWTPRTLGWYRYDELRTLDGAWHCSLRHTLNHFCKEIVNE